jgi:hypothetical protein
MSKKKNTEPDDTRSFCDDHDLAIVLVEVKDQLEKRLAGSGSGSKSKKSKKVVITVDDDQPNETPTKKAKPKALKLALPNDNKRKSTEEIVGTPTKKAKQVTSVGSSKQPKRPDSLKEVETDDKVEGSYDWSELQKSNPQFGQEDTPRMLMSTLPDPGPIRVYDVSQAYVQSTTLLNREFYVRPPKEIDDVLNLEEGTILKVIKPLYGIPEAGNHWFSTYHRHHTEKLRMKELLALLP